MGKDKIGLLLLNFYKEDLVDARGFINILDSNLKDAIVITDSPYSFDIKNIDIIYFNNKDGLKGAIKEAINKGVKKIVLFENYTLNNALWFLPYLDLDGLVVERKRSAFDFLNRILDFFSPSPISKITNNNIILDAESALSLLHSSGIYEAMAKIKEKLEIIKEGSKTDSIKEFIENLTNKYLWKYAGLSLASYAVNIGVFLGSLLALSPIPATLVATESGTITNFLFNGFFNLKQDNKLKSFAKYNSLASINFVPQVLQVLGETKLGLSVGLLYPINLIITFASTALIFKLVWSRKGKTIVI